MQPCESLCVKTGVSAIFVTVRHKTLPQDVVVSNKDAGMVLYSREHVF
jgi:hypothetical protein